MTITEIISIVAFMVAAGIFACVSIAYAVADMLKKPHEESEPEPVPVPEEILPLEPELEPEPVIVEETVMEILDHVDAESADVLITDEAAMNTVEYERGAGHGKQGLINIGVIDKAFDANEVITLAALKRKGLVPKNVCRTKILADGVLSKPLTIKSENFSVESIKMIELTGGKVIILID